MVGRFVVLDLTTVRKFLSNIKPSPEGGKNEKKKKRKRIDRSKIEETKNTTNKQTNQKLVEAPQ